MVQKSTEGDEEDIHRIGSQLGGNQSKALRLLLKNGVYPSMKALAEELVYEEEPLPTYGYDSIYRLEERGLVEIDEDHEEAENRGKGAIVLTEKGQVVAENLSL